MKGYVVDYQANHVLCREGDPSTDLYYLMTGKLLICTVVGTQVKTIARINPGEFIGELSFFDGKPRASHIVTLERCKIVTFPKKELTDLLPVWYTEAHKNLTKKIRLLDHVIQASNIRKVSAEEQKPLTIDEQRKIFSVITQ